jgi:hypothetical protein
LNLSSFLPCLMFEQRDFVCSYLYNVGGALCFFRVFHSCPHLHRPCFMIHLEGEDLPSSNYMLWKESLNSDGQQFHQYQQNEQLSLTFIQWTQKNPWHMTLEIQILDWDRHKTVAGLNWLSGYKSSPLDNWFSNDTFMSCPKCLSPTN